MKIMKVDVLLYHPEMPQETRVELRIPMEDTTARRLLEAQRKGICIQEQAALHNLASAVAYLNGLRGMALRIDEVRR